MNKEDLPKASEKTRGTYEVHIYTPTELSTKEIARCVEILKMGEAVDITSAERDLPRAHLIALARLRGKIVAVGSIKHERRWYATRIALKSGIDFPRGTLELGYVAVDPIHRKNQLSQRLVRALLIRYEKRLFATTYSDFMKITLSRVGFVRKGKEWLGRKKNTVSFWERNNSTAND